jgi:protein TonB
MASRTTSRSYTDWGMGLDENAIEAIKAWKFMPGTKDGQPVPVTGVIEVSFRLVPQ